MRSIQKPYRLINIVTPQLQMLAEEAEDELEYLWERPRTRLGLDEVVDDMTQETFLWISICFIVSGIGELLHPLFPNTPISWVTWFLLLAAANRVFEALDGYRNSRDL
jgi:hypothetical protein